jgi:hypothetical protein
MQYRPVLTVQGHGDGNMRATHSPLIYVSTKTTQSSCRHIHVIMTSTHGGKAPCRRGTGPRAAPRSPQSRSPAAVAARTAPACPESDSRPGSNLSLVSFLSSLARNQFSVRYSSRKHAQAGGENEAGCSGAFLAPPRGDEKRRARRVSCASRVSRRGRCERKRARRARLCSNPLDPAVALE